jgi:hypothetical protein
MTARRIDVHVYTDDGCFATVYAVRPLTPQARDWMAEHTPDDAQWLGGALMVEHRYLLGLIEGMEQDGLKVVALANAVHGGTS